MATSVQLNLPPLPVNRVADEPVSRVNEVDLALDQAQLAVGRAVQKAITRSGAGLKEFGDKGQVSRWCQGENPNVARLFQRRDTRREFIKALAEESGQFDVRTQMTEKAS
jgi:hypothetical protein